jgi:glycine cleavage system transcriptional repressor
VENWYMLTVVGADRPGIVARVTAVLFEAGFSLGEASMMRLGGNFTMMLMVRGSGGTPPDDLLAPAAAEFGLRVHVDFIEGRLHQQVDPDVLVTVSGADRAGIVAEATGALFRAGLDILHLESDVAGSEREPIYIMHIEGRARDGIEALRRAVADVRDRGIDVTLAPIDTLVG